MADEEKKFKSLSTRVLERIERNIKGVALGIHENLVETTPVDTGWAKNNWLPKVGGQITEPAGSPESVDTNAATSGLNEIAGWKSGKGPINITNNVPYIGRLNQGSSDQAPEGFVEKAVQKAVNKFR